VVTENDGSFKNIRVKINEELIVAVMDYRKLLISVSDFSDRIQIPNIIFCFRHEGLNESPG
jgi:hypothetical protein